MNRRSFLGLLGLVGMAPKVVAKAITPPHFPPVPDPPPPWTPPVNVTYFEGMGDILVSGEIAFPGDMLSSDSAGRVHVAKDGERVIGTCVSQAGEDSFVMRLR